MAESALLRMYVSEEQLKRATETARVELQTDIGPECQRLMPPGWPDKTPEDTLEAFLTWFSKDLVTSSSAGRVSLIFARCVLSTIGTDERLSDKKRRLVDRLCAAIEQRPLPTMLWAEFVRANLDRPAVIGRVLSACVGNAKRLENRIREISRKYRDELRKASRPIFVFGYSATIVAALEGARDGKLHVVTLVQSLPSRKRPDGELLDEEIKKKIPDASVDVLPDEEALAFLRRGDAGLLLMGCKVVGVRRTGEIEIVNSRRAVDFAEAAHAAGLPAIVVTGSYKLWPASTYERYRPVILLEGDGRNSIVRAELVTSVLTEDGLLGREEFGSRYEHYFTTEGVPVASIVDCVKEAVNGSGRDIGPAVAELAEDLKRETPPIPVPAHFNDAKRYYEEVLQNDEEWLARYAGHYVAIVGDRVVAHARRFEDLSRAVREKYTYGPMFMPFVSRESKPMRLRTPFSPRRDAKDLS